MLNVAWNLAQQKQISDTRSDASKAKHTSRDAAHRVESLEHAVDKLTLINRAMWEIIQKYHPVDDEYLVAKVTEIDMRDGRLDGKLNNKSIRACPECGRTLNKKHLQCIYCGVVNHAADAFNTVR